MCRNLPSHSKQHAVNVNVYCDKYVQDEGVDQQIKVDVLTKDAHAKTVVSHLEDELARCHRERQYQVRYAEKVQNPDAVSNLFWSVIRGIQKDLKSLQVEQLQVEDGHHGLLKREYNVINLVRSFLFVVIDIYNDAH